MNLSLKEKWAIEDNNLRTRSISLRLFPTIYGGIIGDTFGTLYQNQSRGTFHVSDIEETTQWSGISVNTFKLMDGIINGEKTIKEFESINTITVISPLTFTLTDKFDFPLLVKTVESYTNIVHDNRCTTLGCIIYIEFLFRLYHADDFQTALKYTVELCDEYLHGTVYESEMKYYERILSKKILQLHESEIYSDASVVQSLEAALWCCMNNSSFKDTILAAVNLGGNTAEIAALAGTMAGMFFKEDVSGLLPKTNYDYDSLLVKFRDFCAERKN